MLQPSVVICCDIGSPPRVEINHIHAIKPSTMFRVKIGWNYWVRKIQIIFISSSWAAVFSAPWVNNSTNNFLIEIQFPQRWYVMLHNYIIIQENYLVEIRKQLCSPWKSNYRFIIIKYFIYSNIIHPITEDCMNWVIPQEYKFGDDSIGKEKWGLKPPNFLCALPHVENCLLSQWCSSGSK